MAQSAAAEDGRLSFLFQRWRSHLAESAPGRNCLVSNGEEIGWLISPVLDAYYYAFIATRDEQWIKDALACTEAWLKRGVIEPDGYMGWPKYGAAGSSVDDLDAYYADSLLGEAMAMRPVVLLSAEILRDPGLMQRYGKSARRFIDTATHLYKKWDERGAWRPAGVGMVAVNLPYGIDQRTGRWTENYNRRFDPELGFSLQGNKQNLVASWLLAMSVATGDGLYKDRAAQWFKVMQTRLHPTADDRFQIWDYWQPVGPWDYRADGAPKHWIGIHPNPGYYTIDTQVITLAYQSGSGFALTDIRRLINTSVSDNRLWPALAPYDDRIRHTFIDSLDGRRWEDLTLIPWYMALSKRRVQGSF